MSKGLIALSVGALAIALIAGGCGGDDDTSTSSISKAAFIKKADAICQAGDKRVEAKLAAYLKENVVKESEESVSETNAKATEIAETAVIPAITREIEGLRALGAPSGDEDEIEAILEALEEGLERTEEDPATGLRTNTELFRRAKGLSEEYGLAVCGY